MKNINRITIHPILTGKSGNQWDDIMSNNLSVLISSPEQSHLDPNDPANADIMNIIKVLIFDQFTAS